MMFVSAERCLFQLMELFTCRVRRKLSRGLKRKPMALLKKLRRAKKAAEVMVALLVDGDGDGDW